MCWGGDVWAGRAAYLGVEEAICVDWVGRSVRLMGWWLERVGEVDRMGLCVDVLGRRRMGG